MMVVVIMVILELLKMLSPSLSLVGLLIEHRYKGLPYSNVPLNWMHLHQFFFKGEALRASLWVPLYLT